MSPWQWLTDLLGCAVDELDQIAAPFAGAPGRQFVASFAVAFDDCCESGGQVWTRVIESGPLDQDQPMTKCATPMRLHVGVGIVRCAHTLDDQGNPPPADALTTEAHQAVLDMEALRAAAVCCVNSRLQLVRWTPLGGGGCVGGEWDLWVPVTFGTGSPEPGGPEYDEAYDEEFS